MPVKCTKVLTNKELLQELKKMTPEQLEEPIAFKDSLKNFYEMGISVCKLSDIVYFEIEADIVKL